MVTLPKEFVATKYPGYFWNTHNRKLYSLKVSGILTPIAHHEPNMFNYLWRYKTTGGYRVSVKGRQKWLLDEYLNSLQPNTPSEIPTRETR